MTNVQTVTQASQDLERRAVIADLFAALGDRRMADARALLTEDAVWWMLSKRLSVPIDPWLAGYDTQIGGLFPGGLVFELDGWTVDGPRAAVQARAIGTRADGREYRNSYHFLVEFEGKRITKVWEYGDTLHAEQVMRG